MRAHLTPVLLALLTLAAPAAAENWPQWRGPRHDGTTTETGLATSWSATENVRWRLELPGPGPSTPVLWEALYAIAEDGVAKDGVAKDGVAEDGVAKDGAAEGDEG